RSASRLFFQICIQCEYPHIERNRCFPSSCPPEIVPSGWSSHCAHWHDSLCQVQISRLSWPTMVLAIGHERSYEILKRRLGTFAIFALPRRDCTSPDITGFAQLTAIF